MKSVSKHSTSGKFFHQGTSLCLSQAHCTLQSMPGHVLGHICLRSTAVQTFVEGETKRTSSPRLTALAIVGRKMHSSVMMLLVALQSLWHLGPPCQSSWDHPHPQLHLQKMVCSGRQTFAREGCLALPIFSWKSHSFPKGVRIAHHRAHNLLCQRDVADPEFTQGTSVDMGPVVKGGRLSLHQKQG